MNAPRTLVEKVVGAHVVSAADGGTVEAAAEPPRTGDTVRLRPRTLLTHDNTAAVLDHFLSLGGRRVADPEQLFFAIDHDVENDTETARVRFERIREFADRQGIRFRPAGTGIGHQLVVEEGLATPGALCCASDSHANLYGAVGALGVPVVRTDAACVWLTGETWWVIPPTVRVELIGALVGPATGKDVVLALLGAVPSDVVAGRAVEVAGPGLATLGADDRLAVANMTTEWGAIGCVFEVDGGPRADASAPWERTITLDLATVRPVIAGPDRVDRVRPVAEVAREQIRIDRAFVGSCAGGRLDDLAAAAAVLAGRRVHDGVTLHVAAASESIRREAERRGIWRTLLDAGAVPLPSACGPCIGLGSAKLAAGEVCVSSGPRNFRGRMGSRDATVWLASPAVVAASALSGVLGGHEVSEGASADALRIHVGDVGSASSRPTVAGGPSLPIVAGPALFVDRDDVTTDAIYAGRHTYRDLSPAEMAAVVFENLGGDVATRLESGTILVAGERFGVGSSREQAVTALVAAGVRGVVVASVHATYLRNAVNHGFLVVESPALVARLREPGGVASAAAENGTLEIDPNHSVVRHAGEAFPILPLARVVRELLAAGGIRGLVPHDLTAPTVFAAEEVVP